MLEHAASSPFGPRMNHLRENVDPLAPDNLNATMPQATITHRTDGAMITLRETFDEVALPRDILAQPITEDLPIYASVGSQGKKPDNTFPRPVPTPNTPINPEVASRILKNMQPNGSSNGNKTPGQPLSLFSRPAAPQKPEPVAVDMPEPIIKQVAGEVEVQPKPKGRFWRIAAGVGDTILKGVVTARTYTCQKIEQAGNYLQNSRKARIAMAVGAAAVGTFMAYKVGAALIDHSHHSGDIAGQALPTKPSTTSQTIVQHAVSTPNMHLSPDQARAFQAIIDHPDDFHRMCDWANNNPGADLNRALEFAARMNG